MCKQAPRPPEQRPDERHDAGVLYVVNHSVMASTMQALRGGLLDLFHGQHRLVTGAHRDLRGGG